MPWTSDVQRCLGEYNRDITRDEFSFALPLDKPFINLLFQYLDTEGKGVVPLQRILTRLQEFDALTSIDQLRYILRVHDNEGSGLLDMGVLKVAITTWCHSLNVCIGTDKIESIAGVLFESCTASIDDTVVSISEVTQALQLHPTLPKVFTRSAEKPRKGKHSHKTANPKQYRRFRLPKRYLSQDYLWFNRRKVIFFLMYVAINLALFSYGSYCYRHSNGFVVIARGCGFALNFNCAVVMLFVLRTFITYLRTTRIARYLPLDQHVLFHRLAGTTIGCFGIIHSVCHVSNVLIECKNESVGLILRYMFTWHSGVGYLYGSAYLTGWLLFVIILLMLCLSSEYIRHRCFKVFYLTHLLAFPFIILCTLHGPRFWKWMLLPTALFVMEKIWGSKLCKRLRFGDTYIREAHLLPNGEEKHRLPEEEERRRRNLPDTGPYSRTNKVRRRNLPDTGPYSRTNKVVHIVMLRPRKFKFQPGDYIFVQMPTLSMYEWHPFTISSCPEDEDISCHVRSLGDWTKRLYGFFDSNPNEPTQEYTLKLDSKRKSEEKKVRFSGGDKCLEDFYKNPKNGITEKYAFRERNGTPVIDSESMKDCPLPTGLSTVMEEERCNVAGESDDESDSVSDHPLLGGRSDAASRRKVLSQMSLKKLRRSLSLSSRRTAMSEKPATQTSFEVHDNEVRVISKLTKDTESLRVYIDGPYGTPTRGVFQTDHAVLIATGIGITPFASVMQSIMHRYRRCKTTCPKCHCSWPVDETLKTVLKLKKVDLIWVNREQRNFEWFVSLLSELEGVIGDDEHQRDFLKIHLYMTTEPDQSTLQDIALQAALDQMCKRNTKDTITGLKSRTKFGRPNWDQVFSQIREEKIGKVKVFCCGPSKLASTLKAKCQQHRFAFCKENF